MNVPFFNAQHNKQQKRSTNPYNPKSEDSKIDVAQESRGELP